MQELKGHSEKHPGKNEDWSKTAAEKVRLSLDKQRLVTENILKQAERLCIDAAISAA
jgi:hypothetical protein